MYTYARVTRLRTWFKTRQINNSLTPSPIPATNPLHVHKQRPAYQTQSTLTYLYSAVPEPLLDTYEQPTRATRPISRGSRQPF